MKKPLIGIAGSVLLTKYGSSEGYRRSYVNEDYVQSVLQNGGIPVIIPVVDSLEAVDAYIDQIDALILSGGHDVTPQYYGEEPKPKIGQTWELRDWFESSLLEKALEKKMPVLGICRGLQIMNVFHGGSLWQDLTYMENIEVRHMQGNMPDQTTHLVDVEEGSKLYEMMGREKYVMVNTYHHQAVRELGEGFRVTATSADGVVEAIENDDYPFYVGVQWHPEMLHQSVPIMNNLFSGLIEASQA